MALLHIKMTGKLRGNTDFVTLNTTLSQAATSKESWDEASLKANPEVMSYLSKGYVTLVTEEEYQQLAQDAARIEESRQAAAEAADATIEGAIENDNPSLNQMRDLTRQAKTILDKLEGLISGAVSGAAAKTEKDPEPAPARAAGTTEPQIKDDGFDLPMAPPKGMQPGTAATAYLRKPEKARRAFLKECRDIGLLREIALFEADPKVKVIARKAARNAEKSAEEAISLSQSA